MADEINLDADPHADAEIVPFPPARAVHDQADNADEKRPPASVEDRQEKDRNPTAPPGARPRLKSLAKAAAGGSRR